MDGLGIAHVHWAFPPTTGGVESHLLDLVRLQSRAGHRVVVVTGEPTPAREDGYGIVTTPLLDLRLLKRGSYGTGYARDLRAFFVRLLGRHRIDVVHAHDLHHFAAEPAMVLDELRSTHGFALHHTFHETWPDVLAERPVYRRWDANYAVSRFVQEGCIVRLGFSPTHLPLAIDTSRFSAGSTPLPAGRVPVLLHPARLLPWKGVHVSVRALARLRAQGVAARLVVTDTQRIADWNAELDDYRVHIAGLVEELGLQAHVSFASASYDNMPGLYAMADVVLYPTVGDEPFGLVPIEAMACGRPVVATASGGIKETILDGETGFVVGRNDPAALAARIKVLLDQPALAREMGRRGRVHVLAQFDLARFADTLEASYRASL